MDSLTAGERVRFVADSKNGDWTKGQYGFVVKNVALPPRNLSAIYIIRLAFEGDAADTFVWATEKDIATDRQMTIFDALQDVQSTDRASSDTP